MPSPPRLLIAAAASTLMVAWGLSTPVSATTPTPARTSTLQGPPEHIDRPWVTQHLNTMVATGYVGVTGAFVRPGEALWSVAAGATAKPEDGGHPLTPQHRMRIGSISKPVVATAAMRLVERGVWKLDDPVNTIKPGLLPGHDDITLRHLLSHTSGLKDGLTLLINGVTDPFGFLAAPLTAHQVIDAAVAAPSSPAGSVARYSNTGYLLMGLLLEHQTQQPLRTVLLNEVFGPAGMHTAEYHDVEHGQSDTHQYLVAPEPQPEWLNTSAIHPAKYGGSSNVEASPADVVRFWQALANGTLVSKETFALMRTPTPQSLQPVPSAPLPVGERAIGVPYGLGVATFAIPSGLSCTRTDGTPITELYGHNGNSLGTVSESFVNADGSAATASSTNTFAVLVNDVNPTPAEIPWLRENNRLTYWAQQGWFCDRLALKPPSNNPELPRWHSLDAPVTPDTLARR